ncbi:MAG: hypothetical protein Kow0069_34510 [Promethearchaeota archaeon]
MSQQEYDYLFKCIAVGDGGCGKTALTVRFAHGFFQEQYKMTIGVEFAVKLMELSGYKVKLQVWDTGGQERFSYVRPLYYRGAMGALVLFDVTNRESFEHVPNWLEEVRENVGEIPMVLVGNKADLVGERQVTFQEGKAMADQFGMFYLESSAKTGEGVGDCFGVLAALMIGIEPPAELVGAAATPPMPGEVLEVPEVPEPVVATGASELPFERASEFDENGEPVPPPVPEPVAAPAPQPAPKPLVFKPAPQPAPVEVEVPPVPEPVVFETGPAPEPSGPILFKPSAQPEPTLENTQAPSPPAGIRVIGGVAPKPIPKPAPVVDGPPPSAAPAPPRKVETGMASPIFLKKPTAPAEARADKSSLRAFLPSSFPSLGGTETAGGGTKQGSTAGGFVPFLPKGSSSSGGSPPRAKPFVPFTSGAPVSSSAPSSKRSVGFFIPTVEDVKKQRKKKEKKKKEKPKKKKEKEEAGVAPSVPQAITRAPASVSGGGVVVCPQCGHTLASVYKFCNRCGYRL